MSNWFYPNVTLKKTPKDIRCTDCRTPIVKFNKYHKHNHGRYCSRCSMLYEWKYAKVEVE